MTTDTVQMLTENPHVQAQVDRLMEPMRLIHGTKDCPTRDQVLDWVATGIAVLRDPKYADLNQTANIGGIIVHRGPVEGYSVSLWATDIYSLQVGLDFWKEDTGRRSAHE